MSRWFESARRPGHVDWSRRAREDQERSQQVLYGLIAVNLLVFVAWTQARSGPLAETLLLNFLCSVESVSSGRVWTLLTACFSQMDVSHLLFNMLALWVFGQDVGRALGSRTLLQLYVVGGIVSMLAHVAFGLVTGVDVPALGASGSVMAISVLFAALFPQRTLLIMFVVPMPAAAAVGLYILLDVFGIFGGGRGNIAHAAHLGGAAYGLLYWWLRIRRPPRVTARR
jgi:rhomboid-like protein